MGSLTCKTDSAPLPALIALAQADEHDDTDAMNAILRRYEPMTKKIASVLTTTNRDCYDDVANACRIGLVRAVRRHDPSRAGFTAYAQRFMRGAALRELHYWSDTKTLPTSDPNAADPAGGAVADERLAPWGSGLIAELMANLSPEQQRIAALRYRLDASLAAIAGETGTSVPAVSQRLRTIHRKVELALAA
jgi:RNA polymerase sigma factor (sigma-70 family)